MSCEGAAKLVALVVETLVVTPFAVALVTVPVGSVQVVVDPEGVDIVLGFPRAVTEDV